MFREPSASGNPNSGSGSKMLMSGKCEKEASKVYSLLVQDFQILGFSLEAVGGCSEVSEGWGFSSRLLFNLY